jgi:hypothetical protein
MRWERGKIRKRGKRDLKMGKRGEKREGKKYN